MAAARRRRALTGASELRLEVARQASILAKRPTVAESPHGIELFGVGGVWRSTTEWDDAYSMVMVDGCPQMADVHDRMPVLLRPDQYDQWLQGSPDDAFALVQTCHNELRVDRTVELWSARGKGATVGKS